MPVVLPLFQPTVGLLGSQGATGCPVTQEGHCQSVMAKSIGRSGDFPRYVNYLAHDFGVSGDWSQRGAGAGERSRTSDPRITNAVLCQLSYAGARAEYRETTVTHQTRPGRGTGLSGGVPG